MKTSSNASFISTKKPVMGDPAISSKVSGAIYHFSNAENKTAFDKDAKGNLRTADAKWPTV